MPFTNDEIGMETLIAEQLDEIAAELNGLADQLRRKPFAAVEQQLTHQYDRLGGLRHAAAMVKQTEPNLACQLLRKLTGQPYEG